MELQKKQILTQNGDANKEVSKKPLVNNGNGNSGTNHIDLDFKKGCSNDEITNKSQQSIISVRKIEDLCKTPQKSNRFGDLESIENIKVENINSPKNFASNNLGKNLMKWHLQTETPSKHKRKRQYLCNEGTPERKIKRELCSDNDYDHLSDAIKSELCDNELNDLEAIDMLHDFNSVMDFEESKIHPDIFCSTINETMQSDQTEETSRDPEVDPLYIADNDNTMIMGKLKSNNKDTNVNYDDLKDILGKLDIEVSLEEEEEDGEEEEEEGEEEGEEEEEEGEEEEEEGEEEEEEGEEEEEEGEEEEEEGEEEEEQGEEEEEQGEEEEEQGEEVEEQGKEVEEQGEEVEEQGKEVEEQGEEVEEQGEEVEEQGEEEEEQGEEVEEQGEEEEEQGEEEEEQGEEEEEQGEEEEEQGEEEEEQGEEEEEQGEEEENELSEDAMKKLYNLKVKLMHKVPIQHKIEHTAGSKTLTKREKKLFLKHGPLKSGIFTPNEDKVIMDNWKAFCKAHDWNPKCVKPFIHMKHANRFYIKSMEERQKFTRFLANNLPWRTLYSVFHRFKYLCGNHEKSFQRYTSAEDNKILSYMKNKQNEEKVHRFSELSKMLGRSSHSIWSRYQLLKKMQKNKDPLTEIKWTLSLIGKFIKTFMSVTLCETVEDLKDAIIPKPVWRKLEEKLGIHHNTLKKFWIFQLHMQLFCREPIYLNDIKIKLIEYIYGKGISNSREIVWSNVAKYFDGVTTIFLCKIFFYLVQEAALKINTKNFPDIVEYLYNEKIQDIKNESTDKFLPRLLYNGKVKIIDEDLNEDISM